MNCFIDRENMEDCEISRATAFANKRGWHVVAQLGEGDVLMTHLPPQVDLRTASQIFDVSNLTITEFQVTKKHEPRTTDFADAIRESLDNDLNIIAQNLVSEMNLSLVRRPAEGEVILTDEFEDALDARKMLESYEDEDDDY